MLRHYVASSQKILQQLYHIYNEIYTSFCSAFLVIWIYILFITLSPLHMLSLHLQSCSALSSTYSLGLRFSVTLLEKGLPNFPFKIRSIGSRDRTKDKVLSLYTLDLGSTLGSLRSLVPYMVLWALFRNDPCGQSGISPEHSQERGRGKRKRRWKKEN